MIRLATLGLLATLALGCEGRDVTVFELAAGGDVAAAGSGGSVSGDGGGGGSVSGGAGSAGGGGGAANMAGTAGALADSAGGDAGIACGSNADCSQGWFCEKPSCEAATGLCDLRPTRPTTNYQPACGCDGVTYWNDVARRQAGTPLLKADQCSTTARPCDFGSDCVVLFASCARLVSRGEQCSPSGKGACWLLPPSCPDPAQDPDIWQECRPPSPAGPPPCIDTCSAIRSERPQQKPHDPPMCPSP